MPAAAKVSWAQLKVGVMALAAVTILGVLVFLLSGSGDIFTSKATLKTYMSDSAAMAPKSQVRLNGILIGEIDKIEFTNLPDPNKVVVIEMKIKREFLAQIPSDSQAEISASNLLGDKFINITKGKSGTPIADGGSIPAKEINDIPELMNRAGDLLGGLQVSLKRVDVLLADVEAGKGNIGLLIRDDSLYRKANATIDELQRTIQKVTTGKGAIARLINDEEFFNNEIRRPFQRIDGLLAGIERGEGTAGKLLKDDVVYNDLRKSLAEMRTVIEELNAGKGTAGKLLKDDQLYKQLNLVVAKIDTTIDKVNSGQGTLGQLLVNPQLYESLNGTTREAQALIKDIRANPKKFLRIKLAIF